MLKSELEKLLIASVEKITKKKLETIHLEPTSDEKFGDFASNIAMMLSKEEKKNPRELAQALIENLHENDLIEKTEIAGPGFINFWLSSTAYVQAFAELTKHIEQKSFGHLTFGKGKTAITDSSHPNVAKPMGVHHLLSTIIGQSINNLLKQSGYQVIRDNYIGDWGTQFGKLTYAIRTWGDMEKIQIDPIPELLKLYIKFHEESEKDPILEDRGREEFKKLEEGHEENRKLWSWIRELSLEEFEKIWKRLGVEFDLINGESFYEDKMPAIIEEGLKKKVIVKGKIKEEAGGDGVVSPFKGSGVRPGVRSGPKGASLIIPMDDPNLPPCLIQKSDGATTYATRDLARIKYWQDEIKADLGVNIVDVAQKLHFTQIFESAKKLGIDKMEHIHIEFGRMEFPEGGMSTRKGKVVLLEDLLDEAEKRAAEKIQSHESEDRYPRPPTHTESEDRYPRPPTHTKSEDRYPHPPKHTKSEDRYPHPPTHPRLPKEEQAELARMMGIGAVKYNILSQSRQKNYTFVWDQMLSFEGNSAPYLQYAYTRTQSILKKVESSKFKVESPNSFINYYEEKTLLKKLLTFEEAIEQATKQYKPNLLCIYLFELSQAFSHFYNNLRILDAEENERERRLALVQATAYTLKKGLEILGIEVPERM